MNISHVLSAFQFLVILAYLTLSIRLFRTGRAVALPFFFAYISMMTLYEFWHPVEIAKAAWAYPWVLYLRFCMTIDAVCLVTGRLSHTPYRRYLLLSMLMIGGLLGTRVIGYFDMSTVQGLWYAVTQYVHVGLGGMCMLFNVYQLTHDDVAWDERWLPHMRLVSLYVIGRAVVSFLHSPGDGLEHHQLVRIWFLLFVCAWVCTWLWYDRQAVRILRLLRISTFERRHPAP